MRKKRKLVPVELWQLGKVESWLTEQGQNGLQLEKFNGLLATFQQSEPQQVEYRMVVMPKKDTPPTNTGELALEGWDFVASHDCYHVFRSQKADATSEIEPNLAKQADALTGVMKKARNQILINLVSIAVVFIVGAVLIRDAQTPIENFIEGLSIGILFMIFTSSCTSMIHLRDYLGILRIKRQLEQGIALDYRAYWQFTSVKKIIWHVSYLAVIIVAFVVLIKQVNNYGYQSLPNDTTDLPVLRIHMIEPQERLGDLAKSEEEDWSNSLITNWTMFAPVQYETRESVTISQENQAAYSPALTFKVTECVVPSLASALYDELAGYYELVGKTEISTTTFDQVLVEQLYDDYVRLLTLKDKRVQYVDYQGEADIETILQALENL